jgi:hypothetical protein
MQLLIVNLKQLLLNFGFILYFQIKQKIKYYGCRIIKMIKYLHDILVYLSNMENNNN